MPSVNSPHSMNNIFALRVRLFKILPTGVAKLRQSLRLLNILLLPTMALIMTACHDEPHFDNDPLGNFDALAHIIDTRYCFLNEKDIDWQEITSRYRKRISPNLTEIQTFAICAQMLDELKDGHVNLSSRFNTSYYRKWWTDYPQNFNMRTLEENYLNFEWQTTSGMIYKVIEGDIGYIYYPSFSYTVSESALDYILISMWNCRAIIFDIRDNGGGQLTNVSTIAGRFINDKTIGGYIYHKTGPGHSDFSKPYPVEYSPTKGHLHWDRPVYILTNRSCFSSANDFVAVMKEIPTVKIVGAKTGGGGGLPFTSELPYGWAIRFSACPLTDAHGVSIEDGIDPTPGYECTSSDTQLADGIDAILDFAIRAAKQDAPDPDTNSPKK